MICPHCGSEELKVNESRDLDSGSAIRRRRQCLTCEYRFTTYERIENPGLLVVKRSGSKESYSRSKIAVGIMKAFEKRNMTQEEVEKIVSGIDKKIHLLGSNEIESSIIGDIVMEELKCIDDVAYLRFASVYKSFSDAESFKKEAEEVSRDTKKYCRNKTI